MSIWIDTNNGLKTLCEQLNSCQLIALDTEFIRTDTYYPKLALIQLSDGHDCWLIDVLAIDQFSALKQLIESPNNSIILHACGEDLEVLDHCLNIQPTGIFDTQIAAGMVNIGYSMGYARLVKELLGIELDKQETRSNWLARPLTQRQIEYATLDVIYLHKIHSMLVKLLDEQGRMPWFKEEITSLFNMIDKRKNNHNYFKKIKGIHRLNAQSLVALKALCIWRESVAKNKNIPKSRIAKDSVLLEIAKLLPQNNYQLHAIEGMHPIAIKRYGHAILNEVRNSYQASPVSPEEVPQPLTKALILVFKTIRESLISIANKQKIPQEFLFNKRELEAILQSVQDRGLAFPERISKGWRQQWVKPIIESELEKLHK